MAKPTKKELAETFKDMSAEDGAKLMASAVKEEKLSLKDAADGLATHYDLKAAEAKAKIESAMSEGEESEEDKAKKAAAEDEAQKKAEAAAKAQREADEAAKVAAQKKLESEAASAAAKGHVAVNVPKAFNLMVNGVNDAPPQLFKYRAGAQSMPRAHAEHWYSKACGVKVLGE